MTGTWINAVAIIAGAGIGLLLRKGIPQRISDSIIQVEGIAIMVIGLNGIIGAMFLVDPASGKLVENGGLLLFISLAAGCLLGELLKLEDRLEAFGLWIECKMKARNFAKGFVTASLLYCIGAMGIIGSLNDGLQGDSSVLIVKSALDFTTGIVLASALGSGVAFSSIPVFLLQGTLSMSARWISPYISDELLRTVCMVGYAIVLVIGINFACNTKIRTANLLPALLFPILYTLLLPALYTWVVLPLLP